MSQKIRESFLIKLQAKSPETKKKFSKWLDAQSNGQNSLLSLIEHSIDRFGFADIMDHEISKKMYTENLYYNNSSLNIGTPIDKNEVAVSTNEDIEQKQEPVQEPVPMPEPIPIPEPIPVPIPDNTLIENKVELPNTTDSTSQKINKNAF